MVESGSPTSSRARLIAARCLCEGLFQRLEALTRLLHLFEELDHLFALAEPGAELGRRSRLGLDAQRTDQRVPVSVDVGLAVVEHAGLRRSSACACGPMSIELGQRLGLVRDAVGLAAQAVGQCIAALDALLVGRGQRPLRGELGQKRGDGLRPRARCRARRP